MWYSDFFSKYVRYFAQAFSFALLKKLFSIGFLFIFLFNVGGYYFVFLGLKHQAKYELIQQLDTEPYSEENTIEFKVAMTLPYALTQNEFERIDGEFVHQEQVYRLVKQKYSNDTLHLVCILSPKEKLLQNIMSDLAKLSNDIPATSKNATSLLGKLLKDYESNYEISVVIVSGWCITIPFCILTTIAPGRDLPVDTPPPQSFSLSPA